jgi:phosphatidylinositol kinase/protein kinase (PI-3  family)
MVFATKLIWLITGYQQANLVSHELIRVAILWHELWHEGLEEASRLYFTEKNPEAMIAVLIPLHDMIEAVRCTHSAHGLY